MSGLICLMKHAVICAGSRKLPQAICAGSLACTWVSGTSRKLLLRSKLPVAVSRVELLMLQAVIRCHHRGRPSLSDQAVRGVVSHVLGANMKHALRATFPAASVPSLLPTATALHQPCPRLSTPSSLYSAYPSYMGLRCFGHWLLTPATASATRSRP